MNNDILFSTDENGLPYLQFKRLLAYPNLAHRFTLKPLDFMSAHAGNAQEALLLTAQDMQIPAASFCKPQQTHSDHIRVIDENDIRAFSAQQSDADVTKNPGILPPQLADTDGLITDCRGCALLLTFADCTPLLFYDPVKHVIANIHSGWRGTLAEIGRKAVEKMTAAFASDPADQICCIGPHIHKECFEVDQDVADLFLNQFNRFPDIHSDIIYNESRRKYFIDTLSINRKMLTEAGLLPENVIDSGICTVCHADICQSYRADREKSGRSAAILMLK